MAATEGAAKEILNMVTGAQAENQAKYEKEFLEIQRFLDGQRRAEAERVRAMNTALLADGAENHSAAFYSEEGAAVEGFVFDRDFARDEDPLPDLSGLPPREPRRSVPSFDHNTPPAPWDSQIPPSELRVMADTVAARKEPTTVSVAEVERLMAQPLRRPSAVPETHRLESLNPFMGPYLYDTYSTRFTPWDFIRFKEAQQPWMGTPESSDLPSPVFFTSKHSPMRPSPDKVENFEDDIEAMLRSIAKMPKAPAVMTMGELKAQRLNRGLPWAFMHTDKK